MVKYKILTDVWGNKTKIKWKEYLKLKKQSERAAKLEWEMILWKKRRGDL
jgi:hypothetical protein